MEKGKKVNIYQRSKIYKLVSNISDLTYIGSTTQTLSSRLGHHRTDYKLWKQGKHHKVTSYDIIEEGDYDIVLLENYPCKNKEELHARERYWIEKTKCVNKYIPTRTDKEWRNDNKEHLAEKQHQYWEENKDKLKEQQKKHRVEIKDKLHEYEKQRWQKPERKLKAKIYNETKVRCDVCDQEMRRDSYRKHINGKQHLENINEYIPSKPLF
jgi:hypothetical protein